MGCLRRAWDLGVRVRIDSLDKRGSGAESGLPFSAQDSVQHSRLCDSSSMQEQPPGATQVDAVVSTCAWIGIYTLLHQQSKHVSLGPGRMFLICAGQCYLLAPSSPATFNQMRVPSAGKLDVAPSIYNLNLVFVRSCMVTAVPS